MTFKRNRYDHASNYIEDAEAYAAHLHMRYGTSDHMTDRERRYQEAVDAVGDADYFDADDDELTTCDCGEDKQADDPVCVECDQGTAWL